MTSKAGLWDNGYGVGLFKAMLGWTRGTRTDTGGSLYHTMPLNARLSLEQAINSWTNKVELQIVGKKSRVDSLRNEPATPGYSLVNLHTDYEMKNVRLDLGITNLFNKYYSLPLGGVDIADWGADGSLVCRRGCWRRPFGQCRCDSEVLVFSSLAETALVSATYSHYFRSQ